jgi:hypothetical protein
MDARGIRTADEAVHFAQILGMADPLTLALAQVGQLTLAALNCADGVRRSLWEGRPRSVAASP